MRNSKLSFMEKKLGNCCVKVGSGITPKGGSKVYTQEGIPFIRSQNVYPGGLHLDDIVYISLKQNQIMASTQLKPLDVLLNITGASIGRCCVVPQNFRKGNVNQHVCIIRCDDLLDPYYLCYFLNSSTGQKQINSFQAGGNRQGLNYEQIKKIIIPYLSMKEQKRITEILSIWDLAIEILSKLINAKTNLKKGLMRKLLTGEIRFKEFKNDKWQTVTLNNCCSILDNKRKPVNESERNQMRGDIPYYGANGLVDYVNDYIFDEELILIAEDGGYFDEFATRPIAYLISGKSWVNNHAHVLKAKEGFCQHLIFYCLVHKNLSKYLNSGTRSKLNRGELEKIKIGLPANFNEQKRIADVLLSLDRAIDAMTSFSEKLKNQKKGLMQKLLTGKIRVKT